MVRHRRLNSRGLRNTLWRQPLRPGSLVELCVGLGVMSGSTSYHSGGTPHTTLSVTHHARGFSTESDSLLRGHKRGNAAVACLVMVVGLGSVMPFNALVNVVDYFYSTYDDSPVEYYIAIAFGLAQPVLAHIMHKVRLPRRARAGPCIFRRATACRTSHVVLLARQCRVGARNTANHARIIGVFALQGVQFLVLPGYTSALPAQEAYWITLGECGCQHVPPTSP